VDPIAEPVQFYGGASSYGGLDWSWVDQQLRSAGTYWVVARSASAPHPRPVWGAWYEHRLLLSLGSPVLRAQLDTDPTVTVHLDSGTDVVIVEGTVREHTREPHAIAAYDGKYDYAYDPAQYGPLAVVQPTVVLAWRAVGFAGRDGFESGGRWRFG
jgi:hypothetical protein